MSFGCDISTGYTVTPSSSMLQPDNRLYQSPGRNILFSPESPQGSVYSSSFTITPGTCVLIDAYNLPENQPIYVNRIVKSTGSVGVPDMCDPCAIQCAAYGLPGTVVFRERMRLGCSKEPWQLIKTADNVTTQLLIAVPGMYELELSSVGMLGTLEVEYISWDMRLTVGLPSAYYVDTCSSNDYYNSMDDIISSDSDNDITTGSDGKLKVKIVSGDTKNNLKYGSDRAAFLHADSGTM